MQETKADKKIGDLIKDAESGLADLLQFKRLTDEQWFMRLSTEDNPQDWELLTNDSQKNNVLIRERIAQATTQVNDLILAFVGTVNWRAEKSLTAHGQYFRTGYKSGLLFGSHLESRVLGQKWRPRGGFLIMGGCQNIWI